VLGAGFSASEQFPLVMGLRARVLHFLEAERHSSYRMFMEPGNGGHAEGQFYAGLHEIDPNDTLEFEELLIALQRRLQNTFAEDPCHTTLRVLKIGCARLLWCIHNSIWKVGSVYENFVSWLRMPQDSSPNAIVSFNWDVLVERTLADSSVAWSYWNSDPSVIPVLKPHGSINWSGHLRENLRAEYGGWKPLGQGSRLSYDSWEPLSNPNKQEINSDLRYMIFPGDPELPDRDEDVRLLWDRISEAVLQREAIAFVGYSLPEYDSFATERFKELARGKRVEVYTPNEKHLARFESVFPKAELHKEKFEHSVYAKPSPGC